jgi:hypothetical protein
MRGAESLLLIAFLGLISLGLWNARDWLRSPHFGSSSATTTNPIAAVPTKPTKALKSKKMRGGHPGTFGESVTEVDVPVPEPRFPEPQDLKSGMTAEQIVGAFGEPTARVTRPEPGDISERLYYVRRDHTRATVANLQSGVLVSAETMRF